MGEQCKKENMAFQQDYDKMFAKGTWSPQEIDAMKNLKKLIYYNLAIEAMEEGQGHPGAGHLPEMSYARGRNAMGQYTSGNGDDWEGRSGHHPYYPDMGSGMYYDGMNDRSGRRYYDSEKEKAIHKLHHMMDNTDDPERKNALKIALNELELK